MLYDDFITLPFSIENIPPEGHDNSDQYPESLARYFIKNFTDKEQKIFDPFLGFGTSAFVAEELERVPYGIEADGERFEWAAGQLEHWNNIHHGDSADMCLMNFPKMDFCITSPPYMPRHEKWNPLYGGDPAHAGYDSYLARMDYIFARLKTVMKKNARIVVHVDNLQSPHRGFTPLVRDMGNAIAKSFRPEADIIIRWNPARDGYSHTHCLVFKNT